jgi:hypothetical protein
MLPEYLQAAHKNLGATFLRCPAPFQHSEDTDDYDDDGTGGLSLSAERNGKKGPYMAKFAYCIWI